MQLSFSSQDANCKFFECKFFLGHYDQFKLWAFPYKLDVSFNLEIRTFTQLKKFNILLLWICSHFRNSHSLGPVIVQSFMLLCSFLIILGLIYVVLLVLAIAIHHFLYDRDPQKVPDYVKNSIQFSSSESEDEQNDQGDSDNESQDG